MKYRLEITEKKNGKKLYVPQVGFEKLRGFFSINISTRWENIIRGLPSNPTYETSTHITEYLGTEEEALEVIEGHKEKMRIKNGETPSNVTYKEIL
jgi:hypothetical protein